MLFFIIVAILFFGLLVAIHEWGHFIAAKLLDVQVNEFAIGMGPLLWSRQKGETKYSLRAIPMGGFCAMEGEDGEEEEGEDATPNPRSFSSKSLWKKLVILTAGSFMNLVAGFLIIVCLTATGGQIVAPILSSFTEESLYTQADGLQPGDRFLSIDGRKVSIQDYTFLYLALAKDEKIDLVVERNGQRVTLPNFPLKYYETEDGAKRLGLNFTEEKVTPGRVLGYSIQKTGYYFSSVWLGFQMLFNGEAGVKDLSGPVGIVSMIGQTGAASSEAQGGNYLAGLVAVCHFIALVAVNLAIMNMLPIPALDGGRIFLLLVNQAFFLITRRNINPKYEAYIHAGGFVLLIGLMIFVTFQDVFRLVG